MVLTDCNGLRLTVKHDVDDLEYRTGRMKHWQKTMREALLKYAEIIEVLNLKIGQRLDALQVIEDYADTLDPSHGQIVRLRLLEGMKWAEIASATGYCVKQTRIIFHDEMANFPEDLQERFSELWEAGVEVRLPSEGEARVNNTSESVQKVL